MQAQYSVLGYRPDLYFHEYNPAIEVDELGNNKKNVDYELKRQNVIESSSYY